MSNWSSQCLETEDNNNKLINCKVLEMEILQRKLNNPTSEMGVEPEIFYDEVKNAYKSLSSNVDNDAFKFTRKEVTKGYWDVKFWENKYPNLTTHQLYEQ